MPAFFIAPNPAYILALLSAACAIVGLFRPSYTLDKIVGLLTRISGSSAQFINQPYAADIFAKSVCGGWQINLMREKNMEVAALGWAEYIALQPTKHQYDKNIIGNCFGISRGIRPIITKIGERLHKHPGTIYRCIKTLFSNFLKFYRSVHNIFNQIYII